MAVTTHPMILGISRRPCHAQSDYAKYMKDGIDQGQNGLMTIPKAYKREGTEAAENSSSSPKDWAIQCVAERLKKW